MRRLVAYATAMLALLVPLTASASENVTIEGRNFYLNGKPWLPKGLKVEAFSRPAFIPAVPQWMNDPTSLQGRKWWSEEELKAARTIFGATVLRFAVSQPALDPQSPIYDPKYLDELLGVFKRARDAGFVVIPSMDAQNENGILNLPCMPSDSTVRAWKTLAPHLGNDQGVMFELSDEPCKWSKPETQKEWAQGMQPIVDVVRSAGAHNILLLDGLWYARQTNGLYPLLHDPLPNRMALAVHPYLVKDAFITEKQWHDMFGASAAQYPMVASEWNATDGCVANDLPDVALSMVRYLQRLHIGLVGWAIDSRYGKLVKDHEHFEPIDYANFHGCIAGTKDHPAPPSDFGAGKLLAKFPNN